MSVVVFCGPTISHSDAARVLPATYLPPAAQGDVYRIALERPAAIAIVDGYFHQVPSVWHKEILWALSQGVPVYGSASIGALRAAELAPFGMRGVGAIYEDFAAGRLDADDEVAVLHSAPPECRVLSEPLVNIRATLSAAERAEVIDPATRSRLVTIARWHDFKSRSYARLLGEARLDGVDAGTLDALERWLPGGHVDQKRLDALAMLAELAAGVEPVSPSFVFEHTVMWDAARRAVDAELAGFVADETLLAADAGREPAELAARAREKQLRLAVAGLDRPTLEQLGLSLEQLVEWHVTRAPLSFEAGEALAGQAGADAAGFLRALLREYAFSELAGGGAVSSAGGVHAPG